MIFGTGNIYGQNQPRQAEHTDTRQAIEKHDPNKRQRRNPQDDKEPDDLFDMNDQASVSVTALRTFLGNYLYNSGPSSTDNMPQSIEKTDDFDAEINEDVSQIEEGTAQDTPVSAAAAHAANVYQRMAERTDRRAMPRKAVDASQAESLGLTAEDTRKIHALLDDLRMLSARGIETIAIERGENFLDSLIHAVEKAKIL